MSMIFDPRAMRGHQARAAAMRQPADMFLFHHCAAALQNRLHDIRRAFAEVAEIGPLPLVLTDDYVAGGKVTMPIFVDPLADGIALSETEFWPFAPASLDGIVSVGHMHWVNDLPGTLAQFRHALRPDGVFLAAFFGGESLHELRASIQAVELEIYGGISPRVSPFVTLPDMAALLQRAQFALPVVDNEMVTITYPSIAAIIKDLRVMGQTNAVRQRDPRIVSRDFWPRVEAFYRTHFAQPDGKLPVTVEIIHALGWSPAASQPQPLKRGSATHRLEDILKRHE